jgi:aspartate-semialdehyde dehydrogenase
MDPRKFPVGNLKALASAWSAGKTIRFRDEAITVEELTENSFGGVDIALFSAGGQHVQDLRTPGGQGLAPSSSTIRPRRW